MDSLDEPSAQSFIVKVWVEDRGRQHSRGVWYGHITHVPDHERHYLKNLGEIEDFIAPRLIEMGVNLGVLWRIKQWLKHLCEHR